MITHMEDLYRHLRPNTKYVGTIQVEAEKAVANIVESGGIAWLENDYSYSPPGMKEWMGYRLCWYPFEDLMSHVQRVLEQRAQKSRAATVSARLRSRRRVTQGVKVLG